METCSQRLWCLFWCNTAWGWTGSGGLVRRERDLGIRWICWLAREPAGGRRPRAGGTGPAATTHASLSLSLSLSSVLKLMKVQHIPTEFIHLIVCILLCIDKSDENGITGHNISRWTFNTRLTTVYCTRHPYSKYNYVLVFLCIWFVNVCEYKFVICMSNPSRMILSRLVFL